MKYEVKRFYFYGGGEQITLPNDYEPIGYDGNYVYAKKLVNLSLLLENQRELPSRPEDHKSNVEWEAEEAKKLAAPSKADTSEGQMDSMKKIDAMTQEEWQATEPLWPSPNWTHEDKIEHAKQLATHWDDTSIGGEEGNGYDGPFHPDDLDYVHPDDVAPESLLEPLTINPVDRILLENSIAEAAVEAISEDEVVYGPWDETEEIIKGQALADLLRFAVNEEINPVDKILLKNLENEYAWEDEQNIATSQGGVFRHCEECNKIETIYPLTESYMFSSDLDFCTRCEKPWGMGMEKDAWAEGQMMPGMREGIKIEAPDPIDYRCILCSYKSEDFAKTGVECAVDEYGMHDWMLVEEYWEVIAEHQDNEGPERPVYKPCIFCYKGFEDHNVNTHGYEPRERCRWCTLDEHMHHEYMHEYEILTEPRPNKGYCQACGTFNDRHASWCKAIPRRVQAQRVCPVGFHDDISMHLCQCSAAVNVPMENTNTGYTANMVPAQRQQTDDQMSSKYVVDGGRDANAKAYTEQYGTDRANVIAKVLASDAQRGDSPKVRCPSCQQDQMECNCA